MKVSAPGGRRANWRGLRRASMSSKNRSVGGQLADSARPTPSAATRRATTAGSAPTGTRTTRPHGRTTSTVGSAITRTAANDGLGVGGAAGRRDLSRPASSRRLAKKVASATPRAAQKARTDWPDCLLPGGDRAAPELLAVGMGAAGHWHGWGLLAGEKAPIVSD